MKADHEIAPTRLSVSRRTGVDDVLLLDGRLVQLLVLAAVLAGLFLLADSPPSAAAAHGPALRAEALTPKSPRVEETRHELLVAASSPQPGD